MKKILFFLLLGAMAFIAAPVHSQIVLKGTYDNTAGLDTLAASDTVFLKTISSLSGVGLNGKYAIELKVTNISGTTALSVTVEGSMIGGATSATSSSVWSTGINKVPGTDGNNCDSLTVTAAGVYYITIAPNAVKELITAGVVGQTYYTSGVTRRYYIRLRIRTPATTQSTQVQARLITMD